MKKIKIIFLVLTMIVIAIPIVNFNFTPNSVSAIDNRKLTEMPLGNISDISGSWNKYVNDRIGLRDKAINTNTRMNDVLFNEMIHPSYEYGKDGYVFFKMSESKHDYEFLDVYVNHIKNIQDYCEDRNVPFIYVIDPAKTTIYQQFLPNGYQYENDRLNYLVEKLKEEKINFVNNTELLLEKSKTEQVFNKQYDAGHWNDLGAFYGVNNIIDKVRDFFPEVKLNSNDDFEISTSIAESLPVSQFEINEEIPSYVVKDELKKNIKDLTYISNEIRLNQNYHSFSYIINDNVNNDLRAMFLQGSYLNTRTRMTQLPFSECVNIHSYENAIDFDYYFNIFQPDIVIFEGAEYATTSTYFNQERMQRKEFNPLLNDVDYKEIKHDLNIERKENIYSINVDIEKNKYAYIQMKDKVFDLLWDEDKQNYYCDIDKDNYSNDYSIFVVEEK